MTLPKYVTIRSSFRGACAAVAMAAVPAFATPFLFSTGPVTDLMASATRPDTGGVFEIESADDFVLGSQTQISSATFTGLLLGSTPSIGQVVIEIYRVFPSDSDVGRTSGPPTFSTSQVRTRVNSPSDVALRSAASRRNAHVAPRVSSESLSEYTENFDGDKRNSR